MLLITMKVTVVILFCLLFTSLGSALPIIEIYGDENFQQDETIVGNISSINQSLTSSNLKFFEGRREVSFEKNIVNYGGNYYFSVIFNREGNFSLKLENVLYYDGDILKSTTLEKSFNISEKENNSQILSIKPGVIVTTEPVELLLTNKGEQIVNFSYGKNNKSSLEIGETGKITVFPTEKFSLFEIKSYKIFFIPIIYFEPSVKNNETIEEKIISLRSSPKIIELSSYEGDKILTTIDLFNFGIENLTKISINSNIKFLRISELKELTAKSSGNITLSGTASERGLFKENITISYSEKGTKEKLLIPITVYVFQINASEGEIEKSLECFDIGGKPCLENEICDGTFSETIVGCCIGFCADPKKDSSSSKFIVGILILAFLGGIGFLIYKKFKNVKPKQKIISS